MRRRRRKRRYCERRRREFFRGGIGELGDNFHRRRMRAKTAQQSGEITAAGADMQNCFIAFQFQRLQNARL